MSTFLTVPQKGSVSVFSMDKKHKVSKTFLDIFHFHNFAFPGHSSLVSAGSPWGPNSEKLTGVLPRLSSAPNRSHC